MIFNRLKLGSKLIFFFLLVGLVPMLAAAGVAYYLANNTLDSEIKSKLDLYATQKQYLLEEWFQNQRSTVSVIAASRDLYHSLNVYNSSIGGPEWQERNRDILLPFLQKVKQENGYTDVFLTDGTARIISATNDILLNGDLSTREYIKKNFRGEVATSDLFYSDVTKSNIIVVASPIYSEGVKGRIIGAFGVFLDANEVSGMVLDGLDVVGKTADAFLVNDSRILLTLPRFGQGFEVLKTKIENAGTENLTTALRGGNNDFHTEMVFRNHLDTPVLGSLRVINLGDYPVGMVISIDQAEAFAAVNTLRNLIFILVSCIALVVAFFGYGVARSLSKPILKINEGVKQIAQGDLTVLIESNRGDELGELASQQNIMVRQVANLVSQIIDSAERVQRASQEIAVGNQDLSQRTQEQASTLEEIASTMEEVTSSIQQVAANSDQADQLSQTTLQAVNEGERSIQETIDAMGQISASSRQIAEIIKVVNDIAFQTNLLALNAAVEAARAGEQGRGFAVVAAEVRNLAGRTAESAKEIEKLISESVTRVEKGNELVKKSSEMLEQIVANTKRTSDVIVEVAAAMREQSSASQQIQASIDQLNQVTQQNAAMVEEITSSSQSLNAEAESLRDVVGRFKVEDNLQAKTNTASGRSGKQSSDAERSSGKKHNRFRFIEDSIDQF